MCKGFEVGYYLCLRKSQRVCVARTQWRMGREAGDEIREVDLAILCGLRG